MRGYLEESKVQRSKVKSSSFDFRPLDFRLKPSALLSTIDIPYFWH